jgi:translation initiation factor IF-3
MKKKAKEHKLNLEITAKEVRVIDEGIMSLRDALSLSESKHMDLVLINENANPPICRVLNYEKFIYEQSKKPKNKTLEMKEIKLGPNISQNDMDYRVKHMIEFLGKGHKVKVSIQFRGREMQHTELGHEQILKMLLSVEDYGVPEFLPKLEGKKMFCIVRPKPTK